jgi:hypothetical protein
MRLTSIFHGSGLVYRLRIEPPGEKINAHTHLPLSYDRRCRIFALWVSMRASQSCLGTVLWVARAVSSQM